MNIFNVLSLVGGLCLFLFGMSIMGQALERSAGKRLQGMLGKLTGSKTAGILTGIAVTAVIQSSSATTVMVVGFVNSGLMTLRQSINVIMGSNIGTTITAWILSLGGISGDNIIVQLLKPMSFTPILALLGIVLYMFSKTKRKQDIGTVLLGFSVLMFGMNIMTDSVAGLAAMPQFSELLLYFKNPLLGVVAGAVLTAILQSSSASVGMLQALAVTGSVTYAAALPIIMGQNIGTCVTAWLSSFGTNRNAKRAALVHLSFNIIGTILCLTGFSLVSQLLSPAILDAAATMPGIAAAHSIFNVLCTLLLLPASSLLEKLVCRLAPDPKAPEAPVLLDERLLATPSVALERCRLLTADMAQISASALKKSLEIIWKYDGQTAADIRKAEEKSDHYEDIISSYLIKLSTNQVNERESTEAAMLLKSIGDFERLSDHAVNILESAEELRDKALTFSEPAQIELHRLCDAVNEILALSVSAFSDSNLNAAEHVEPLEQVIDGMKDTLRSRHIARLQRQNCSMAVGFVWSDLLTDLERCADHCSNIAACVIDAEACNLNLHQSLRITRSDSDDYRRRYRAFAEKYSI